MARLIDGAEHLERVEDGRTLHRRAGRDGVVARRLRVRGSTRGLCDVERARGRGATQLVCEVRVSASNPRRDLDAHGQKLDRDAVHVQTLETEHARGIEGGRVMSLVTSPSPFTTTSTSTTRHADEQAVAATRAGRDRDRGRGRGRRRERLGRHSLGRIWLRNLGLGPPLPVVGDGHHGVFLFSRDTETPRGRWTAARRLRYFLPQAAAVAPGRDAPATKRSEKSHSFSCLATS
jgi:hypothetical protein